MAAALLEWYTVHEKSCVSRQPGDESVTILKLLSTSTGALVGLSEGPWMAVHGLTSSIRGTWEVRYSKSTRTVRRYGCDYVIRYCTLRTYVPQWHCYAELRVPVYVR